MLAGDWIELPASLVASMAAELPTPTSGSPIEPLQQLACGTSEQLQRDLHERGLTQSGDLVPWLARSMSVLLWPEALIRTRDTAVSSPTTHFVAADTLVRYEQAAGVCLIGQPRQRDAVVDELVALSTAMVGRVGDPPVLELTRWTLQALDTVLGASSRTRQVAHAALATLTPAPDGPDAILTAMLADELLVEVGGDVVAGPLLSGWEDALDGRNRLEIQRLDLADGPDGAQVRTMVFIGPPGDRCLIVPQGGDEILLVKPTAPEASTLIDAFVTPGLGLLQDDEFEPVAAAWRASADALIKESR